MAWFDCAVRRPIRTNTGGLLSPNLGLVLHHAVMDGSLFNFFNNPSAQVSAHFWIGQNGTIEQYVDTGVVAWHGRSLNSRYVGVETEGCRNPPYADPMSDAMFNALKRLWQEGQRRHGWLATLANRDGERGLGFHRMAVATACPCDIRLSRRPAIIQSAPSPGPSVPPPAPPPPTGIPPFPGRLLKYPPIMNGEDVRTWQAKMAQRGWRIVVDGSYGPASQTICRQFQQEKRLGVDGIVGPQTWNATWTAPVT